MWRPSHAIIVFVTPLPNPITLQVPFQTKIDNFKFFYCTQVPQPIKHARRLDKDQCLNVFSTDRKGMAA